MNIFVDITHCKTIRGKMVAYEPEVTIEINDQDVLDMDELKRLKDTLQREIADGIKRAQLVYDQKHTNLDGANK